MNKNKILFTLSVICLLNGTLLSRFHLNSLCERMRSQKTRFLAHFTQRSVQCISGRGEFQLEFIKKMSFISLFIFARDEWHVSLVFAIFNDHRVIIEW